MKPLNSNPVHSWPPSSLFLLLFRSERTNANARTRKLNVQPTRNGANLKIAQSYSGIIATSDLQYYYT